MDLTDRILIALEIGDRTLTVDGVDILNLTVQEILLYISYCRVFNIKWRPRINGDYIGLDRCRKNDALIVLVVIESTNWYCDYPLNDETKEDIIEYTELYGLGLDPKIAKVFDGLSIPRPIDKLAHNICKNPRRGSRG